MWTEKQLRELLGQGPNQGSQAFKQANRQRIADALTSLPAAGRADDGREVRAEVELTAGGLLVTVHGRAMSLNQIYSRPWPVRHRWVKAWRNATADAAVGMPKLLRVRVEDEVFLRPPLQDVGNSHPALKAVVDGLRDAGVLVDDTADIVQSATHLGARKAAVNRYTLRVVDIERAT